MSLQSQKLLEQQTSHSIQLDSNHFNNNFEKKNDQKVRRRCYRLVCVIFTFSNSWRFSNKNQINPKTPPSHPGNSTKVSKHISLVDGSKSKAPWSSNTSFKVSAAFSTPGKEGFVSMGKSELSWKLPISCKRGWCFVSVLSILKGGGGDVMGSWNA